MSCSFELVMDHRDKLGTAASRRLRRLEKKVPVVLYGKKQPSIHLAVDHNVLFRLLENDSFYSAIVNIQVGSRTYEAVLKGIRQDPIKPKILDAEFLRIEDDKPVHLSVPLHFQGEEVAPGVKQGGGVVSYQLNSITLSCLPKNIPDAIVVDISTLGVNEPVKLSQLPLPDGVSLARGSDRVVVTIIAKRGQAVASA